MRSKLRAKAKQTLSSLPVYRVLPPGALRDYAAVQHLAGDDAAVAEYVAQTGRPQGHRFSTGWITARAAYATGRDDIAIRVLEQLADRFPEVAEIHWLRGELSMFLGEYDDALEHAVRARLLDPGSAEATASTVRLHYLAADEEANHVAVGAVRRFPRSVLVLYTACSECRTVEQFSRLARAWETTITEPADVRAAVRPLAVAAARVGLLETAVELYAEAILLTLNGIGPRSLAPGPSLRGKGSWAAIRDVRDVLQGAGIPFFFAAGTALGLVREGRPLGHDSDVDVGVFEEDWDPAAITEAFRQHASFRPVPVHPRGEKIGVRHRGGSPVDVFRFYEEDGRIWHNGTFVRWHNTPFEVGTRSVRGIELRLPENEDEYLTENYGPWCTPDPKFDAFTEAPNAQTTWPEYLDFYLVRRAYIRMNSDQVRLGLTDLRSAEDVLGRTSSGRAVLQRLRLI